MSNHSPKHFLFKRVIWHRFLGDLSQIKKILILSLLHQVEYLFKFFDKSANKREFLKMINLYRLSCAHRTSAGTTTSEFLLYRLQVDCLAGRWYKLTGFISFSGGFCPTGRRPELAPYSFCSIIFNMIFFSGYSIRAKIGLYRTFPD